MLCHFDRVIFIGHNLHHIFMKKKKKKSLLTVPNLYSIPSCISLPIFVYKYTFRILSLSPDYVFKKTSFLLRMFIIDF